MNRPFIFEGLDGAGKTTLAKNVATYTGVNLITRLSPDEDAKIKDLIKTKNISVEEIHRLYMKATHSHLVDVVQPKIKSGDMFLIDRWIAGMLATHVLRKGILADWTIQRYDWKPVKSLDCIFVRVSTKVRKQRAMARGTLTKTDKSSFSTKAETVHLQFAQRLYRRVILIEATNFNKQELLEETLQILKI
mgnify:CR=1 FL=1